MFSSKLLIVAPVMDTGLVALKLTGSSQRIPTITLGNAYVRKICCK